MRNGDVDPSEKEGGALGMKIPRLTNFLAQLARRRSSAKRAKPARPGEGADRPSCSIIADRTTPYRLLVEVMYSAKQKEAGYKHFRLIVQKNFPVTPQQ